MDRVPKLEHGNQANPDYRNVNQGLAHYLNLALAQLTSYRPWHWIPASLLE